MQRFPLPFIAAFALIAAGTAPLASAQGSNAGLNLWTHAADMSAPRSQACSAILKDGGVLVAGGLGSSGPVNTAEIYGTGGTFSVTAPMSQARKDAACTTLLDGRVLVTGGDDGNGPLSTAEIFDPSQQTWTTTGGLSVAREGHQAVLTAWGAVWVVGGANASGMVGALEQYDVGPATFRTMGTLNTPRKDFALAALPNRKAMIAGGTDGVSTLSSVEIYDGVAGAVAVAGSMAQARKDFAAAALPDGTVLLTGGLDINGALLNSTEIYDPVQGVSTAGPNLLTPRAHHFAYGLTGNGAIVIGGGMGNSGVLSSTETYSPWTGAIQSSASMSYSRRDNVSAVLRPGNLLVAGGRNETGSLSSSELFQYVTIGTDKPDYSPGTPVKISGGGWQPGEQVFVQITAFPLDQHHVEFTGSGTADGAGNVTVSGFQVDQSHLGMKFILSASGSRFQAQTSFTDKVNPTITFTFTPPSGAAPGSPVTVLATFTGTNGVPTGFIKPCLNDTCPAPAPGTSPVGVSCNPLGGLPQEYSLVVGASSSTCTFTINAIPAGNTLVGVQYIGDANYNFVVPGTPGVANDTTYSAFAPAATTTSILIGPTGSQPFGIATPYVAQVVTQGSVPTGQVQFQVNGVNSGSPMSLTSVGDNSYVAAFVPSPPLAVGGPYLISAIFLGDASNATSSSASVSTTITAASTQVSLPSITTTQGNSFTFSATVTTQAPNTAMVNSGTLSFYALSGAGANTAACATGTPLGTAVAVNASGIASSGSVTLGTGPFTVCAVYTPANGNFSPSISPGLSVTPASRQANSSTVTLTASSYLVPSNQPVVLMASVNGSGTSSLPTGTVTFTDNGVVIGTVTLVSGQANLSVTLSAGSHNITATYNGDTSYPGSSAIIGLSVLKPSSAVSVTSSSSTSVFGQMIMLTAHITGTAPTGTVQFFDGAISLGTANVVNGVATLTVSNLPPGVNNFTAVYSGDANNASGTGSGGSVTVSKAQIMATLTAANNNGQETLTATVAIVAPGGGTPTGTIQFIDTVTGKVVGTATLAGGMASITIPVTTDPIMAVYSGDGNFSSANSANVSAVSAVNAASYLLTYAPDEIVTVFGTALTTQTLTATLPLPMTLGGVTVTVTDSASTMRQASIFYVSPTQMSFLIPSGTANGAATITVTTANGSFTDTITVATSGPGLFTANANGAGPLAAQLVSVTPSGTQTYTNTAVLSGQTFVNAPISFTPAANSFYLLLYGTGIRHGSVVTVTINGKTSTPVFTGAQGAFAGLDQINVLLPASLAGSGAVNVSVTVDGQVSNTGTISFQ